MTMAIRSGEFTRVSNWWSRPDRSCNAVTKTVFTPQATHHTADEADDADVAQLGAWADAAMKQVTTSAVDDYFIAEVPGIPEAWVDGKTANEAIARLHDVLMDWAELAIEGGHVVPPFDGVYLNP